MVDLGLPSGTLWKQCGEDDYYSQYDALAKYSYELPTEKQIKELIKYCKWSWQEGRYKVIGPNGNYIFMEAKGYKEVFDTKVYQSTDDILKTASDRRDRGVFTSSTNINEVGRQGVYVYTDNGSHKAKLFKFDYYKNSFLLGYSFDDKSSYRGNYSYLVSVHLVNSDNRAVKFSDTWFKQCERRGLPLTDISRLELSCSNGQQPLIGYTDMKKDPLISVYGVKKNDREWYLVGTYIYNFRFADGKIESSRSNPYPSNTITIPGKIRLGDYEWTGRIASSYDYSRPKDYLSDKIAWVNRVQITPPDNITKISFEDGYISEALINLNCASKVEEIHFPNSLRDFELFGMICSDVLIFLPIKDPWEIIDGKRVPLFCGDESNTKFNKKYVFIVPEGSVDEYRKIERFKNARIYTSIPDEYYAEKKLREEKQKKQEEQERKRQENKRKEVEEYKQLVKANKHLYTPYELRQVEGGYFSYDVIDYYKKLLKKRQEIYNLINQHPDLFPSDYYSKVITQNTENTETSLKTIEKQVIDVIQKANNYNRLVGEWTTEKGKRSVCTITSRNNQLFMTLKYNRDIIYEGSITEDIKEEKRIKGGRIYNQVHSSITADNITIYLNVINEVFSSTQSRGGYWVPVGGHTTKYHLSYENGTFVLDVTKDGKKEDSVTFKKSESN